MFEGKGAVYSFTDASTGAIAGLRAYADGPSGMTMVIRSEPGEGNLYGPYSAALRRNGEPAGECAAPLPKLASAIRALIAMQTPGGAE